jgi:hypothetical protein
MTLFHNSRNTSKTCSEPCTCGSFSFLIKLSNIQKLQRLISNDEAKALNYAFLCLKLRFDENNFSNAMFQSEPTEMNLIISFVIQW